MSGRVEETKEWTTGKGRVLIRQGSAEVVCYRHPLLPGLFVACDMARPKSAKRHWIVVHDKTGLLIARTKSLMLLKDVKRLTLMYLNTIDWTQGPGTLSADPQAKLAKILLNISLGGAAAYEVFFKEEGETL